MPFLFKSRDKNLDNQMDADGMRAASLRTAVRTIAPVTGFERISERRISAEEKKLKEYQAFVVRFEKFLGIRLQREELDLVATNALQNYRTGLARIVVAKRAAIAETAVELQRLRLPLAQQQKAIETTAIDVDKAIAQLKQSQKAIKDGVKP